MNSKKKVIPEAQRERERERERERKQVHFATLKGQLSSQECGVRTKAKVDESTLCRLDALFTEPASQMTGKSNGSHANNQGAGQVPTKLLLTPKSSGEMLQSCSKIKSQSVKIFGYLPRTSGQHLGQTLKTSSSS